MRIVLMGSPDFGIPAFRKILDCGYDVPAVVTVPDKQKGRGLKLHFSDIKKFAVENSLPVLQPEKLKDENFISELKSLRPDLFIIIAFRILPKEVFSIPKLGSFNLHASLLPNYRGAAPINHAIMNGEKSSGITTFFLDENVDTGNIILQKEIQIDINDTFGEVYHRMSEAGADAVIESIRLIENKSLELKKQDSTLASKAPKIFKKDCLIDWKKDSAALHNFIRALSPVPSAYTTSNGKVYKILKSKLTEEKSGYNPGTLFTHNKRLFVSTIDLNLEILSIQPEGKKPMSALDFINGFGQNTLSFDSI